MTAKRSWTSIKKPTKRWYETVRALATEMEIPEQTIYQWIRRHSDLAKGKRGFDGPKIYQHGLEMLTGAGNSTGPLIHDTPREKWTKKEWETALVREKLTQEQIITQIMRGEVISRDTHQRTAGLVLNETKTRVLSVPREKGPLLGLNAEQIGRMEVYLGEALSALQELPDSPMKAREEEIESLRARAQRKARGGLVDVS